MTAPPVDTAPAAPPIDTERLTGTAAQWLRMRRHGHTWGRCSVCDGDAVDLVAALLPEIKRVGGGAR